MSDYPASDAIKEAIKEVMDPVYEDFVPIIDDLFNALWDSASAADAAFVSVPELKEVEELLRKLDEMLFERLRHDE